MPATLAKSEAVKRGGVLRDAGVLKANEKKEHRDLIGLLWAELLFPVALLFLVALLANGTATVDDAADDLDKKHDDGGHWLGGIFLRLARQRLIVEVGSMRSCRPARHRGKVTLWGIANREAIEQRRRVVQAMLEGLNASLSSNTDSPGPPPAKSETNIDNAQGHDGRDLTQQMLFGTEG